MNYDGVLQRVAPSDREGLPAALLQVRRHGDRVELLSSDQAVRRRRAWIRAGSLAAVVAGAALTAVSGWAWLIALMAAVAFVAVPARIHVTTLLQLDTASGELSAPNTGARLPLQQITAIQGIYETYGWDGRSALYAVLADSTRVLILVFSGTNEKLAEAACRILGTLLDCPATYAGPFGGVKTCHEAATPRSAPSAV